MPTNRVLVTSLGNPPISVARSTCFAPSARSSSAATRWAAATCWCRFQSTSEKGRASVNFHLHLIVGAAALLVAFQGAHAQGYPNKPIRIIVPHAPGGAADGISRGLAIFLPHGLGQPVIVENRPGAGGINGAQACARAAADREPGSLTTNDVRTPNPVMYHQLPSAAPT